MVATIPPTKVDKASRIVATKMFFSQMAKILLKLCQGLLTDETRRKASYNHGSKVLYSLVRAISKTSWCLATSMVYGLCLGGLRWVLRRSKHVSPVSTILEVRTLKPRPVGIWMVSGRCLGVV